jgi:superoxide reductase
MNMQVQTSGEKAPTHKPVVNKEGTKIKVSVGQIPHSMDPSHYIDWVEVETQDGTVIRKELKPGDKPEVIFDIPNPAKVRSSCTTHGVWETEL